MKHYYLLRDSVEIRGVGSGSYNPDYTEDDIVAHYKSLSFIEPETVEEFANESELLEALKTAAPSSTVHRGSVGRYITAEIYIASVEEVNEDGDIEDEDWVALKACPVSAKKIKNV